MATVHFAFPTISRWRVSLYGVGAPVATTALYTYARSIGFGRYDGARCWDSSVSEEHEILSEVSPGDLFCATATVAGYESAIGLLRKAKRRGAAVAIGGPWVSVRAKEIAAHQPWIDFIVLGEGEAPLAAMLRGEAKPGILGSLGRSPIPLPELPAPDFSRWQPEHLRAFADCYRRMIESGEYGVPPSVIPAFTFYMSTRGCIQRPRCAFCGYRAGSIISRRNAKQFHADLGAIQAQHADINPRVHVFDTSDSFTTNVEEWCRGHCFAHDGVTLTVFVRVDEVTEESAKILRRLGVTKVSLGIETGSDAALDMIGKHTTIKQNALAVEHLAKADIQLYLNYLYGVPGESVASLARTVAHVLELCEIAQAAGSRVYRAKGRVVTPLPGSRWYSELRRARPEVDHGADAVNTEAIVRAWLAARTQVGLDEINSVHAMFTAGVQKLGVTFSNETATWFG